MLDGRGGLHPFGGAPDVTLSDYWPFPIDIARGVAVNPISFAGFVTGYVLDAYGGVHPFVEAGRQWAPGQTFPHIHIQDYWGDPSNGGKIDHPNWDIARGIAVFPDAAGGYPGAGFVVDGYGGVHPFWLDQVSEPKPPPQTRMSDYWGAISNGGDPTAPDFDIARGITLNPTATRGFVSGYTLDGYGGVHPFMEAGHDPLSENVHVIGYHAGSDTARSIVTLAGSAGAEGYLMDVSGVIHAYASDGLAFPPSVGVIGFDSTHSEAKGIS
ncbi:MAG: hypothetical protein ACYDAY_06050 [Candidatus Dormibacteria bacterium]